MTSLLRVIFLCSVCLSHQILPEVEKKTKQTAEARKSSYHLEADCGDCFFFFYIGTKGNLCQRKMPLGISVALTFPSAMMASYYLLLQTYVLRLEAIMNSILLFFCGSELLLEMLTLATFSRYYC